MPVGIVLLTLSASGVCEVFLEGGNGGGVDDELGEEVVDSNESEERTLREISLAAVAVFVELLVVAVNGESCGVLVERGGRGGDEGEEVRVSLFESDFVDETEHGDVAAEVERGEVVVEESVAGRDVDGVEEGSEKVVNGLKCGGGGVVDGAGAGFGDGKDVGFELVDEGGCGVVRDSAKECFEFRS